MFRVISAVGLAAAVAGVLVHRLAVRGPSPSAEAPDGRGRLVKLLARLGWLSAAASAAVLAGTGFWEVLVRNESLRGYLLMVHVSGGGVFAAALAVVVVLEAGRHRFEPGDGQRGRRLHGGRKFCFWAVAVLSIPAILSLVLSMLRLFGSTAQQYLLETHRYSTLGLTMAGVWLAYLTARSRGGAA